MTRLFGPFAVVALAGFVSSAPVTAQVTGEPVYRVGPGISAPKVISEVKPRYTAAAKKDGIQGVVSLECVVLPDGSVGDVQVVKSLDEGLDEEARKAVRQWKFEPGIKDSKPVAVLVSIDLTFTLRKRGATESLFPVPPKPAGKPSVDSAPDSGVVYSVGDGVSTPIVLKRFNPRYTDAAKAAGVQAVVTIECVVLPNGRVGEARVAQPLDAGLDAEAVNAVKRWIFRPGLKDGHPVAVRVSIDLMFSLR